MERLTLYLYVLLLLVACSDARAAQGVIAPYPPDGIFHALEGGQVANPLDWPASPWMGNCSGTALGEQVVGYAAHCIRNGGTVNFRILSTVYSARCTHNPEYRNNSTADHVLCKVTTKLPALPFENWNTDPNLVKVGDMVTLTGYGCQKWGGQLDGKFRTGRSPVVRLPRGTNYDYVTDGQAAVCSGDSGGALYAVFEDGVRRVIGFNSRRQTNAKISLIPTTSAASVLTWAKNWAQANGVKICGIHADATGCRPETPAPDLAFEATGKAGMCKGTVNADYEPVKAEVQKAVSAALDSVN